MSMLFSRCSRQLLLHTA